MKKIHVALLLVVAAAAGVGTAATIVGQIGFHVFPAAYEAPSGDAVASR